MDLLRKVKIPMITYIAENYEWDDGGRSRIRELDTKEAAEDFVFRYWTDDTGRFDNRSKDAFCEIYECIKIPSGHIKTRALEMRARKEESEKFAKAEAERKKAAEAEEREYKLFLELKQKFEPGE